MSNNLDKTSAKILILGDSGVGKSSLIQLICHSSTLNSAQWTIGCSIDVKLHNDCFLEFWDIGGSRSHKIARSFLYRDYHGIILVFDATNNKSRTNLSEWLMDVARANDKDVDTFVDITVPTITIGTKKDLLPYGTIMKTSDTLNKNDDCSVINFNEPQASLTGQHWQTSRSPASVSDYSSSNSFPALRSTLSPLLPPSSSSSSTLTYRNNSNDFNELLLNNQVIYVNTQDVLSFSSGSKNYEKLDRFFKLVIDRRNKKFYNKYPI